MLFETKRILYLGLALLAGLAMPIRTEAQTPIRVACIGNSITEASSALGPYPQRLGKLLGSGYLVENEGTSGTTLLKKGDSPYWTKGRLKQALAFNPKIVTIKLGTNDTKPQNWKYKAEFEGDLKALIDTLGALASKPVIWLCLPVPAWPVNGVNSFDISGTIVENEVIPIIKKVAADRNLKTIDLHTPMLGMKSHFSDGVHPDAVGQDSLAHLIYRALTATPTALRAPGIASASVPGWLPGLELRGRILRLDAPAGISARLIAYDAGGRALETWTLPQGGEARFSLAALPAGPCLLTLESVQGRAAKRLDLP
jgi:acyl-CoA thioesterase I